jgi:hypothetical protein
MGFQRERSVHQARMVWTASLYGAKNAQQVKLSGLTVRFQAPVILVT